MTKIIATLCVTATLAGFLGLCWYAWPYHEEAKYSQQDVTALGKLIEQSDLHQRYLKGFRKGYTDAGKKLSAKTLALSADVWGR